MINYKNKIKQFNTDKNNFLWKQKRAMLMFMFGKLSVAQ